MILRIPHCSPMQLLHESLEQGILRAFTKSSIRQFSNSSRALAEKKKQSNRYQDQYAEKQARARRLAHISRQEVLRKTRTEELGDPIRGITTPFVESFDTALPPPSSSPSTEDLGPSQAALSNSDLPANPLPPPIPRLNHFLTKPEFDASLEFSKRLTEPYKTPDRAVADIHKEELEAAQHEQEHQNASEALSRILDLQNSSQKDRTHTNIQRIIEAFGRHNTDHHLRPKAPSAQQLDPSTPKKEPTPRAGPDTGSSEVQIGILTAKIRVLADRFQGPRGNADKVNKRNLRLLLHRRQKLLKYMFRKERGSGRWEYLVKTLGLTEATWKGQISVN